MQKKTFEAKLEFLKQTDAFKNYLYIREWVMRVLEEEKEIVDDPSDYWQEEVDGFDYMLDASPFIINKMREHCYHLTGLRSYEYRQHHIHQAKQFEQKLNALQKMDKNNLLIAESSILGGFGHNLNGKLFNIDTLKFYESLIALQESDILSNISNSKNVERKVVMEIGAGWGGFAYQFKTLFPNTCYVIVDLPQTILFSSLYLKTAFPDSSIFFCERKNLSLCLNDFIKNDFIFIPHYLLNEIIFPKVDLAINIASFQEMTTAQVSGYLAYLNDVKCPFIYSHNRNRSPHNKQLTLVSKIIEEFYHTKQISVLDVPYTNLSLLNNRINFIKNGIKNLIRRNQVNEYKHIVGYLK